MTQKRLSLLSFVALSVLLLSSCQTDSSTVSPTPKEQLTSKDFWVIAEASCELAMREGVVESNAEYVQFMIPKSEAIDGYSAAYIYLESDTVGLIWETDVFASCGAAVAKSMAEEFDGKLDWEVGVSAQDEFEVTQSYPETEPVTINYRVTDGFFSGTYLASEPNSVLSIKYGEVPSEYISILERAIAEFNAG